MSAPRSRAELEALKLLNVGLPAHFEFTDNSYAIGPVKKYLTILDVFIHHYTADPMLYARIEWAGIFDKRPYVEYKAMTVKEVEALYSSK